MLMPVQTKAPARRGRLPAAEREARRARILDAAAEILAELGLEGATMRDVALRAGASKETLYAWFGDREGLIGALIERNADRAAERVTAALDGGGTPPEVLTAFARGLLQLLTSDVSVALNRMAMTSPDLAARLLASGRHRLGPLVESYLAGSTERGDLDISDPGEAFRTLYGLVVRDTQIRVLLGEAPPPPDRLDAEARNAADAFLALHAPKPTGR
jgi:AcrR family transcriptional regulator